MGVAYRNLRWLYLSVFVIMPLDFNSMNIMEAIIRNSPNRDIIKAGLGSFLNKKIHDSATVDDIVKECGKRNGGSAQESAPNRDIIKAGLTSFLNKKIHDSATVDIVKECGQEEWGQNGDIIEEGLRSFLNKKIHNSATVNDIVKKCAIEITEKSALALGVFVIMPRRQEIYEFFFNFLDIISYLPLFEPRIPSTLARVVTADEARHERIEKIKKAHDECQADPVTKADEDVMSKFFKDEPIDETKFAKHALCMNVKSGIQKENGDIDKDVVKILFSNNEKVDEIVVECGEKKGSTVEEAALALYKCFRKYDYGHEHHHHH
ncbi:unnamed protein product [Phaedon cochleariae]|uniref:Uncharacterized protein n=1 Tax=Phaedon cochleariae TaxID=80249 RepID=A0A9N9SPD4_PHACE|nr:unnamed protein product [Phaedon cochleariae]